MFANPMVRMSGITAIGMAIGLSNLSLAQAQPDAATSAAARSIYAPPAASSDVYRPAPVRPYEPTYRTSASTPVNNTPVIYETQDWFQDKDNRLLTFGIASLIVLLTTAGIFHVINKHKDELDGKV